MSLNTDLYNEIINNLSSPVELFVSDRSRNRLENSKFIELKDLHAPKGPLKIVSTRIADGENFMCCVMDKAGTSGTGGVAIFMLEIPKNLSSKPPPLRKLKIAGFVETVQLLLDSVSPQFESVHIALLPCQEKDLREALEVEETLMEKADTDDKVNLYLMNTVLDRSKEAVIQMVSQTGRA